ncbi:putative NADPH-dependent FMN reductase [Candidatus Zixiibacteriota bacterium]|nr:putative NADPH-dependent FMN reductase [candidate division Zixibacteria bacterium]
MLNILSLTASPIKGSSTEILLEEIVRGVRENAGQECRAELTRLNDLRYIPCQACGRSPEPEYCFYHDDLDAVYERLIKYDIILFGSPVYFDSVSAQAKMFIDRCNCLRPPDFEGKSGHHFKRIITRQRYGAMVLVGGERGEFECARKVVAGFFKWVEIINSGAIFYAGSEWTKIGPVAGDRPKLDEAYKLGKILAAKAGSPEQI